MKRTTQHLRRVWIWWAIALVLVGAAVAWRFWPKPTTPPSAEMRAAAATLSLTPASPTPAPKAPQNPRTDRQRLLSAAHRMLGAPYKWGAKGPDSYDCSGFTKAAYAKAGIALPDGSFNQASNEAPLGDVSTLTPGDLLFYRWAGKDNVSHVTMYAGDGWVIGTGTPGQPPKVVLYPLSYDLRGKRDIITYRHIALPDEQ
jgi:cell wall-associated NlpC family hydrolase